MTMTDRQSVAANATVVNVLAGKLFEFASRPSMCRLYTTASAVGLNVSFLIGARALVDDQEVNAQNRMPILPDDMLAEGGAVPGDRIVVRLRNTTAGAIVAFSRIDLLPIA